MVLAKEGDDGEGAGEGAHDGWQSSTVNRLSWDVTAVETGEARQHGDEEQATAMAMTGWRRRHGDDQ